MAFGAVGQVFKGGVKAFRSFAKKQGLDDVLTDQMAYHLDTYQNQYISQKDLKNLTVDTAKSAIRGAYTDYVKLDMGKKLDDAVNFAETNIKKSKRGETIYGFFRSHIDSVSETVDEGRKKYLGDWERAVEKSDGKNGVKMFSVMLNQPAKAQKQFGFSGLDIFKALHSPQYAKIPLLKAIGTHYRTLDGHFIKQLQNVSALGYIDDFVLPLKPNPHIAESLGWEKLASLYEKYTTLTPDQAKKVATDYMSGIRHQNLTVISTKFPHRGIKFRDGEQGIEDQYHLYLAINGIDPNEPEILSRVLKHKEAILQKVYFYHKFGQDPEKLISDSFARYKRFASKDAEEVRDFAEKQKIVLKRLATASGFEYAEYNTLKYVGDGAGKFISALYGASTSGIRNGFLDYTNHGLSMLKAFLTQEGPGAFYYNRFLRPLVGVVKSGVDKEFRLALNDLLNIMDFAQTNTSLFNTMGLKQENFIGEVFESGKQLTKAEKMARSFDKSMGRFNNFIHTITGNIAHFDTTTAVNVWNTAAAFSNLILKSMNYKAFLKSSGHLGRTYLKDLFGLGENEFRALKEAYPAIKGVVKAHDVKRVLGFDDLEIVLPSQVSMMPDSIAIKYKQPFETAEQFKTRVRIAYNSLLTSQRNLAMTSLHRSNRFVEQGLLRGTFIDFILRPFTQFGNINYGQQFNLRVGMGMSIYGTPFNINFKDQVFNRRGAMAWGKALAYYGTGAMMTVWAKDLLYGRKPREWTPGQMALVFAGSGVGGIPLSILAESFYAMRKQSGFYSTTPLGSFIDLFSESLDFDDPNQKYRVAKFLQQASGVGRLWYTRAFIDKLLRDGLMDERARINMENWYRDEMRSGFILRGD